MTSLWKVIRFGLLVWLIPFLTGFAVYPLKTAWRSLFESILPVAVCGATCYFGHRFFRGAPGAGPKQGFLVGLLWMALCIAIDLPLMLNPPIRMEWVEYWADIGLTYVMIPLITLSMGSLNQRRKET